MISSLIDKITKGQKKPTKSPKKQTSANQSVRPNAKNNKSQGSRKTQVNASGKTRVNKEQYEKSSTIKKDNSQSDNGTQAAQSSANSANPQKNKASRSPSQSAITKDATKAEVNEVMEFAGRILTAPGEDMEVGDVQRGVVAILENGTMVATRTDKLHPGVLSARTLAEKRGFNIKRTLYVDLDVIRKIYEKAKTRGDKVRSSDDITKMEKDFLDLVANASSLNASDIYIRVDRFEANVTLRVNGVIRHVGQMPANYAHDMLGASFAMSRDSDASYMRYAIQSTRVSDTNTVLPNNVQALRLQFTPLSDGGRYLVARLLYNQQHVEGSDVNMLGYSKQQVSEIKMMRNRPYGMNIISGPTGSGKSTTLQLALSAQMEAKNFQINIMTIEDPPEYAIKGASQVPILNANTADERSAKFRAAIASALRSAPDIIMVGEIRDSASSSLAFEAAMTGHQVWTTVHANNAISIVDRFRDWAVEDFKLTDETLVTGLIGQRLIRVLCPNCKIPYTAARNITNRLKQPLVNEERESIFIDRFTQEHVDCFYYCNEEGCDHPKCDGGYSGRTVIAECIMPDADFMDLIRDGKKREAVRYWMNELGGILMIEHAAAKVIAGKVDPRDAENKIGSFNAIEKKRLDSILVISNEYRN